MTLDIAGRDGRVVLLDIEGTTTPIAFVHDVLFPFARAGLSAWCRQHAATNDYREVVARLRREHASERAIVETVPDWRDDTPGHEAASLQAYALWLMQRDRKSPGLKLLQGLIWEQGYQSGLLRGDVYPDVPPAMRRWRAAGIRTAIYSSGSELAQRRLFGSTAAGDLTPFIDGFFDTAVGAKEEPASYRHIAASLGVHPDRIVFVSDVVAELVAAARTGCRAVLSVRPGNRAQPGAETFAQVTSFDQIRVLEEP